VDTAGELSVTQPVKNIGFCGNRKFIIVLRKPPTRSCPDATDSGRQLKISKFYIRTNSLVQMSIFLEYPVVTQLLKIFPDFMGSHHLIIG
jgi:hypothetical protein